MTGTTLPAVNGLRIWPYTNYNYAPSNFEMYGGASAASPTWNLIFNPVEVNYESSKWKYFKNIQTATTYPALKFVINSSVAGSVYMYEMQPLVCNIGTLPSITYPSQTYQMYAKYNSINAVPTVYGMTNCQSSTPLPNGITLNPNTCAYGSSYCGVSAHHLHDHCFGWNRYDFRHHHDVFPRLLWLHDSHSPYLQVAPWQ